jgi:hypothetical protein
MVCTYLQKKLLSSRSAGNFAANPTHDVEKKLLSAGSASQSESNPAYSLRTIVAINAATATAVASNAANSTSSQRGLSS